MANRLSKEKANLIASNYCTNGFKKVKGLLEAGYAVSYANCKRGLSLYDNVMVKEAIERIQAGNKAVTAWTFQDSQTKLLDLAEKAEAKNQFASSVSALVAVNRMNAWDKDTQANPDQPLPLSAEKLAELNRQANLALADDRQQEAS